MLERLTCLLFSHDETDVPFAGGRIRPRGVVRWCKRCGHGFR